MTARQDKRWAAQELVFQAHDARDEAEAVKLCNDALKINANCADAIILLAQIRCRFGFEFTAEVRRAIECARKDLGPRFFTQCIGHFWGEMETRPFMRAMALLAELLIETGAVEKISEAIDVYEQMLRLNPNDNQGVRYPLLAAYLRRRQYERADELISKYSESSPFVGWASVLLAILRRDERAAIQLVAKQDRENPHVRDYMTAKKRLPRNKPEMYGVGDESEAIVCAKYLRPAWQAHPKALKWLKGLEASG